LTPQKRGLRTEIPSVVPGRSPQEADDILGLKVYFYAKYVIRNKARSLVTKGQN